MALAFRQGTTASGTTSPLNSSNFASNPTVGQLIVVTLADDSGATGAITNVTDSAGNTYTKDYNASDAASLSIWHTVITATGASFHLIITYNTGLALRVTAAAQEFSGFSGTPTLDILGAAVDGTSTSPASQSLSPAHANEIIIGSVNHGGTASAFSLGSGYTNLSTVSIANASVAQESLVISSIASNQATFTIAASREWFCNILSFYDNTGSTPTNLFFF